MKKYLKMEKLSNETLTRPDTDGERQKNYWTKSKRLFFGISWEHYHLVSPIFYDNMGQKSVNYDLKG